MLLYDYQREAVDKLKPGNILNGGVGSGKSRTALAYFFEKICGGDIDWSTDPKVNYISVKTPMDLYIITTARKRDTLEWEDELSAFILPSEDTGQIHHPDLNIVIDSWNNIQKYIGVQDAFFIFDEQRVVGWGVWTKSFLKIAKKNTWILLTATPGDTWEDYIPVFVANGFYRNKTDFTSQHIVYSTYTKYPKVERYIAQGKLTKLKRQITVPMEDQRHTIRHVNTIKVEYDRELLRRIMKDRWNVYDDCPIETASKLYSLMRRAVNSDPSRQSALKLLCATHPKVIIFYNFDYELEILRGLPYTEGTVVAEWNSHKHEPIPKWHRWVYLVQFNGGDGWNCTETDTMVFFSQNYSYRMTEQASGRIDRTNTPYTDLYYYHLRSDAWIDMAIHRALRQKKNFNERDYDIMAA